MKTRLNRKSAYTLIEILVVLFVIGLLIAIILPAVQGAREAARRAECASRLRSIGQAIHQHAQDHGTFPAGQGGVMGYSYLAQILPYIEQENLHNSINHNIRPSANENFTSFSLMPSIYLCPSDSMRSFPLKKFASNYAANSGSTGRIGLNDNGVFVRKPLSPQDITDGLSQTIGVSEWIVGHPKLSIIYNFTNQERMQRGHFIDICRSLPQDQVQPNTPDNKGLFWITAGKAVTLYNHVMLPNSPSCSSNGIVAYTAGSLHGNGVHSLKMDGSIKFVRETIEPRVWSAVGSRSGGEVVGESF